MIKQKNKETYSALFEELRSRVSMEKLDAPSPIYGSVIIFTTFWLYVIGLLSIGKVPLVVTVVYLYVVMVELGFVSHDLIHNQYFKNKRINRFFSYVSANLFIGFSRSWWFKEHNTEHHTYPNSDIHDTDIRSYDEIFTKNPWKFKFFHEYKRILFWFSTSLLYFRFILLSYQHIVQNRKYGELFLSLLFLGILPGLLCLHFWFFLGLFSTVAIFTLVGLHLAYVFMVNHIGMEIIDGKRVKEYSWLDIQTRTSRNVKWWVWIHEVFGWLNKQIEHHLFPQVSRWNIVRVSELTRNFCKEKGIKYHEVSFVESMREIWETLNTWMTR